MEEEKVLQYWQDINAFEQQQKKSEGRKEYTFYDGPPFATGLPHYGHIAAGTIKDVVTRYATQTGHHCTRRFGWDCHGLPIEYEIDKKYEIKSSKEREDVSTKYQLIAKTQFQFAQNIKHEQFILKFITFIDRSQRI